MQRREDGTLDATNLISRECYECWLSSQGKVDCDKEGFKFRRALSNHLCGVDGRTPFTQQEEDAILQVLRKKFRWPCFPPSLNIGRNGFRSKGFHEKARELNSPASSSITAEEEADEEEEEEAVTTTTTTTTVNNDELRRMKVFEDGINKLISTYASFDLEAWSALMGFARFTVFTKIPIAAYNSYAETYPMDLCNEVSRTVGGRDVFVAVSDIAAKECNHIVLAQNEVSLEHWGVMTNGLCSRVPFHIADLVKITVAVGKAFNTPGERIFIPSVRINSLHDVQLPYDVYIYVDPTSYLVVVHGSQVKV